MLFKKRAAKIVAIAAAVLLLLVAAVTGTVFALRPTHADAVGTTNGNHYFIVKADANVTYKLTEGISFETALNNDGAWKSAVSKNTALEGLTKEESGDYKVYITDSGASNEFSLYVASNDWTKFVQYHEFLLSGAQNTFWLETTGSSYPLHITIATWGDGAVLSPNLMPVTYGISYTPSEAYILSPSDENGGAGTNWQVESGKNFYFFATPATGRMIKAIHAMGAGNILFTVSEVAKEDKPNLYKIEGVTSNITLTIETANATYTVELADNDEHDVHVTLNTQGYVPTYGSPFNFSLTPNTGYEITEIKYQVEGGEQKAPSVNANGNYTIPQDEVTGNIVIDVTTKAQTYTVLFSCNDDEVTVKVGGREISNMQSSATFGENFVFTVEAKDGYQITNVSATSTSSISQPQNNEGTYTIPTFSADFTVTISSKVKTVTVSYIYSPEGLETISKVNKLSVPQSAVYKTMFEFRMSAISGYQISVTATRGQDAPVDVHAEGSVYTIAADDVTDSITITVTVAVQTFTVTLTPGEGYTYELKGEQDEVHQDGNTLTVEYNSDVQFKVKPESGFSVDKVTVRFNSNDVIKDVSKGDDGYYTIEAIKANGTVTVTGVKHVYQVTNASANKAGYTLEIDGFDITNEGSVEVIEGENYTLKLTISEGYTFNDIAIGSNNIKNMVHSTADKVYTYTANDVSSNQSIYVGVSENTYTINFSDNVDDTITPVTLSYTTWAEDKYTLPDDEDDYYKRVWKSEGKLVSEVSKSEIADASKTLTVTAEWSHNEVAIRELLTLTYGFTTLDAQMRNVRVELDTKGWTDFSAELTKHRESIGKLGFLYCSNNGHTEWTANDSTDNALKSAISTVCSYTSVQVKEKVDNDNSGVNKPSVYADDYSYYCVRSSHDDKCQIHVWHFDTIDRQYSWNFTGVTYSVYSNGYRSFRPFLAFSTGNSVEVILAENFTKINEADGLTGWTQANQQPAMLNSDPVQETYEEPAID